jgi:hypothetical protein
MSEPIDLYAEAGASRVFVGALDWPGWCRSGRTEEAAIESLLACQDRYAAVAARAGLGFETSATEFAITERLTGNATTDFGAPGIPPAADAAPLHEAELGRIERLLVACWETFDAVVARHAGTVLRTGPRGGGRTVDKIVAHVTDAELAYLTKLGSRSPKPAATEAVRATALAALAARARGEPVASPSAVRDAWSPRYFVRRAAWHVLDHAWEIEDRAAS